MDETDEKSKSVVEKPPVDASEDLPSADDELKVTVKKLELPVKPRGVLAE